jgi:hypothetical protein
MSRTTQPTGPAAPVTLASTIRVRPDVAYTEVDGQPVVCDPIRRVVHQLSPAAASLWGRLDGRPLADHRPDPSSSASDVALVELVRRLRVMRLVEDAGQPDAGRAPDDADDVMTPADTSTEPTDPSHPPDPGAPSVEIAGQRDGPVVILGHWPASASVRISVDPPTIVDDQEPLRAMAVIDASADAARLDPLEALRALVAAASPDALRQASLDQLAGVAEAVLAVRVPDRRSVAPTITTIAG